ncbi:MAG: ABC transporter ATP-binding protein [Rhodococcus sp. (in: high G+C Gram-positive bacteria)]
MAHTSTTAGSAHTSDTPAPTRTLEADSMQQKHRAGSAALTELLRPIRGQILLGRILAALSGILAIAPYIALVQLGNVLITAYNAGESPNAGEVGGIVRFLIGSFVAQLACYFLALLVTHFADLKLSRILREQIIERIAHAPLAWFSAATSGRIRKAIQDDTKTVHTLVAHAPVETAAATVTPVALTAYAFVIDWRLGLLAVATLPIYLAIQMSSMAGMSEKTAEMDVQLGRVSATAVEFADGISVVKSFGRVGRAHERFARSAADFADFYYAWVGPMLRRSAISRSFVSVPVLLLVNIGLGSLLVQAGSVQTADLLATTLIALVIPGTVEVVSNSAWAYQLAGGAALRIRESLDTPALTDTDDGARPESTRVEFDRVTFSYSSTRALDEVSAVLEPGTVTALVGESGSGKSTMATMLARFQVPGSRSGDGPHRRNRPAPDSGRNAVPDSFVRPPGSATSADQPA